MLATAMVLLMVGPGCFVQPAEWRGWSPEPAAENRRVVLFGDSLGAMVETMVMGPGAADDREGESWSYNAVGGTQLDHWLPAMAGVGGDDVVLVELGTNDVSNNTHMVYGEDMHAVAAELVDAECQVWFMINETGGALRGTPYSSRTFWFNDELQRMVASGDYPNMVLFDWGSNPGGLSAGRVDWLTGDRVHHSGAVTSDGTVGNDVFAGAVLQAAEVCS
jgi:hypothetical protein